MKNNLLALTPSPILDEVYARQTEPMPSSPKPTTESDGTYVENPKSASMPGSGNAGGETMLLSQANGRKMTQALDLPQLEVELERAIWQVESAVMKRSADDAAAEASKGTAGEGEKKSQ